MNAYVHAYMLYKDTQPDLERMHRATTHIFYRPIDAIESFRLHELRTICVDASAIKAAIAGRAVTHFRV